MVGVIGRSPIGMAYAATQVNATIFRVGALASAAGHQYATYFGPGGEVIVAMRDLAGADWRLTTLPGRAKAEDAHNGSVVGISPDGLLHVAYDHHNDPLRYRQGLRPHDCGAFGPERAMTGEREARVTYPQFVNAPDGTLFFFYRDGMSGNGDLCLNRYDSRGNWMIVQHPLIAGLGRCNPYWWRPAFGPEGDLHLAWCWRDTPDAATNHDICYARSADGGQTWQRSDGRSQPLPITPENADVVDPVPSGSNLINQCASAVDHRGRPHFAHYHNDGAGIPQYVHLWHDGAQWRREFAGRRRTPFTLGGPGSLQNPISRPEIAIAPDGGVTLIVRDAEHGGGVRMLRPVGEGREWLETTLLPDNLGDWEPTYDQRRLRDDGILSLFVLPVQQGNHERVTDFPPQEAAVLDVALV